MSEHQGAWAAGTPCWMDLSVPDADKAETFYAALFGWDVEDMGEDFGHYRIARKDGHRVAGLGTPPPDMAGPASWSTYLATDDLDKTLELITGAGGSVLYPAMDVGEQGRMTHVSDPAGAAFGLWQSGTVGGSELANEPGSFTWNECMSHDFEGAKTFYGEVFGFNWFDMSGNGFTYAAMTIDDKPVGGLGALPDDAPEGAPSSWLGYFKVADCDATCAQITELGGVVTREAWDTPFGRMAMVTDDQGAAFALMADNEQSIANAAAS